MPLPNHVAEETSVDALIADFDLYFQHELTNEPLIQSERAIVKTFCWYLLRVKKLDNILVVQPQEVQHVDATSK